MVSINLFCPLFNGNCHQYNLHIFLLSISPTQIFSSKRSPQLFLFIPILKWFKNSNLGESSLDPDLLMAALWVGSFLVYNWLIIAFAAHWLVEIFWDFASSWSQLELYQHICCLMIGKFLKYSQQSHSHHMIQNKTPKLKMLSKDL